MKKKCHQMTMRWWRNTTDPSVAVTDSSATDYDLANESSVCSTPFPLLKKLDGAEPISRPKTIKSILRSKSTFKAKTLKSVIINEPSLAPTKGKKSSSASKVNLTFAGNLKSVKIEDDPTLAIVMKELNDLKLQVRKNHSSYSRNNQPRQPIWYMDNGCSRNMTGVKSYFHKYMEQPGPKVVFRDDSTCTTEDYGSIKYNVYIHNYKDHLGKFDEKANDGYLLGCSLVSKAFRVFNTRIQQTEETYHITFDKSPDANKFLKPSVDNINIAEYERYPPDEYLHPYEPSQKYQTNSDDVSFIEPYECPEPVVLETEVLSDQNGQTDQNDHNDQNDQSVQNEEILNDDHSEHSNHINDEQIIDNLSNTKDIQIFKHSSSLRVEDTLV
nr:retrovirus-related Pol polyprotein from transposon TNT 1-94 [Tanacetum cinerariifolium]